MTSVQRKVDVADDAGKTIDAVVGLSAWSATRSLEAYPKDRGMSGEDRGCFGILFFDNCVFMRVRGISFPYSRLPGKRERAPSPCVSVANWGVKREGKPVNIESDGVTPASRWLWITKVKL